jgi:phage gp46-like protein
VTDVLLRQSNDGGEIALEGGLVLMSEGLETAAYLSLFGGNEQDPGEADQTESWWGNLGETIPSRKYRSETQFLVRSLPAVPSNLRRIEQAALRDLQWMVDEKLVHSIGVTTSIPGLNRVVLDVNVITQRDQLIQLSFG